MLGGFFDASPSPSATTDALAGVPNEKNGDEDAGFSEPADNEVLGAADWLPGIKRGAVLGRGEDTVTSGTDGRVIGGFEDTGGNAEVGVSDDAGAGALDGRPSDVAGAGAPKATCCGAVVTSVSASC